MNNSEESQTRHNIKLESFNESFILVFILVSFNKISNLFYIHLNKRSAQQQRIIFISFSYSGNNVASCPSISMQFFEVGQKMKKRSFVTLGSICPSCHIQLHVPHTPFSTEFWRHYLLDDGTQRALSCHQSEENENIKYLISSNGDRTDNQSR